MAIENVVIAYTADISNIKRQVTEIRNANKILSQQMGSDFSKGINVISSELKKIQFNKEFKIKLDDGKIKKVRGTLSTFEKTVQSTDGQLFKLKETVRNVGGEAVTLSSSITKVTQAQNKLIGASSQLATNFGNLKNVNATFSQQLRSFGQVSRLVGTSMNQLTDNGQKVVKIFETANGKFVQLTQTTKRLPSGVQQVTRSLKQMSKAQAENASTIERNGKSTRGFQANLKSLVGRALLTIPVWFALRGSIQAVFRTIRNGLKDLITFDRALQKLRRNLEATSTDIDGDFLRVQKTIKDFSLKTGKSVEEITNAIQKFATVGFDLETSLAGGLASTKLAITLFGEVEGTAQAFARSLRVLTEDIDTAEGKQKAIAEALALTDQLWQKNAFEINEFSQNLTKFAGTANVANLSIEDTLTLLATLSTGGLANRAGRLLRSTLLKALSDIEKVTRELDLDFDPDSQPTIQFILELVGALKELRTPDNIPAELTETLGELFTVRSTEVIASLVSLEKTLKENIALTPDVEKFNDTFERILKTTGSLAEQFTNINKEIGKAFVTGLTGGEDFNTFLQRLLPQLKEIRTTAETVGFSINSLVQVLGLLKDASNNIPNPFSSFGSVIVANKELSDLNLKLIQGIEKTAEFGDLLQQGLGGDLGGRALKALVIETEHRLELQDGINFNLVRSLQLLKEQVAEEEELTKLKEEEKQSEDQINQRVKNRKEIAELVLKTQLDILKTNGATASQLSIIEEAGRKRLNIEKSLLNQLDDQLQKEREINQEKRLSNELGNESLKLFRIAQKGDEGVKQAKVIGDILSGERDFDQFINSTDKSIKKIVEIFKKDFSDVFEQQQALRFFRGERLAGVSTFDQPRGGSRINIREQAIRGASTTGLTTAQAGAERFVERLKNNNREVDLHTASMTKLREKINDVNITLEQFDQIILSTGGRISGDDVNIRNEILRSQNITNAQTRAVPQTLPTSVVGGKQTVDFNISINGENLDFTFTSRAEAESILRNVLSDPDTINRIVESFPFKEAVDDQINEF